MCICTPSLAWDLGLSWECWLTQRGLKVPVVLGARQAGGALRPQRGRNQLALESGGWAASGSDPLSSLGDVATSGHKDARGLTRESHPVGRHLPGGHFRPRCRIFLGPPRDLQDAGDMVLRRLEFLLAGKFELPRARPHVIGVMAQGLTRVLFAPHSIPFLEPKSSWSFMPSSYVTSCGHL